jgi:hypothetical protein
MLIFICKLFKKENNELFLINYRNIKNITNFFIKLNFNNYKRNFLNALLSGFFLQWLFSCLLIFDVVIFNLQNVQFLNFSSSSCFLQNSTRYIVAVILLILFRIINYIWL